MEVPQKDTVPEAEEQKQKQKKTTTVPCTPAVCKRQNITKRLVIQSPTDHIFSPCSQKLLQKKRSAVDRAKEMESN